MSLISSIRQINDELTAQVSRAVNLSLTMRNLLIGCYIAEYELHGADRTGYGDRLLMSLSNELEKLNVSSCGKRQLYQYLRFYQTYPQIVRSLSAQLRHLAPHGITDIQGKVQSTTALSRIDPQILLQRLSYTHIEHLIAIDDDTKRAFYEIECIQGNWSVRELKRQIHKYGLCAGDLGSVVEIYEPDGLEVEFVKASGETLAVITVSENKVRHVDASDIVSVRSLSHAA